ncbi:serine hydrolase [Streptomyces sp. NPDC059340]|uniref:serine hydrolase n=1 Tax=Streptomyces sp. NPDC059340 TaxID=3346806 RepID=UPI003673D3D9
MRKAGGGDVNVLARVDGLPGGRIQARLGTVSAGSYVPVPWGSHFRTASTTKAFVATVVLQLAAERQLSLNDTVKHWLPGMVSGNGNGNGNGNDGSRVTVRDLLRQTSGLFDYVEGNTAGCGGSAASCTRVVTSHRGSPSSGRPIHCTAQVPAAQGPRQGHPAVHARRACSVRAGRAAEGLTRMSMTAPR